MPVTIKLSRRFYEKLGEDLANELVDWFNKVDATYRGDLREVNELNFARFDAKLEQRLVELDARWGSKWSALDGKLEQRIIQLEAEWLVRWAGLDAKVTALGDTLRKEIAQGLGQLKSDLLNWMFGFWASVVIALAVLALRR